VLDKVLAEAVVDISFLENITTPEHNFQEEFGEALFTVVLYTVKRELGHVRVTFLASKRLYSLQQAKEWLHVTRNTDTMSLSTSLHFTT